MSTDPKVRPFDFKNPDYGHVVEQRIENAQRLRDASPEAIEALKGYYRTDDNVIDFIQDWGVTYDPRSVEDGTPASVPFILFPKQIEYVRAVMLAWRTKTPLLVEKSRDCGVSWVSIALACALSCLHNGFRAGFGSRLEDYVDKIDEPKSLFWKARFFMRYIPEPLAAGYREAVDAPYMRMKFPATGSSLTGEAGDEIGRGDRTSIFFVDESAHIKRPRRVDAALSQTTNCRIDVSSVNGMNNSFATRRWKGTVPVFIFDWRDDPRKDQAWYDKQVEILDPIVVAQEIDRDYQASTQGILIPSKWIKASLDAFEKLGIAPTGKKALAFDVADGGRDKNAIVSATGVEVDHAEEWSGKGDDIFGSVERVFERCDELGLEEFIYDADGLGAGVKGDSRVINDRRKKINLSQITADPYRGSAEVLDPELDNILKGRKNKNVFWNRKAQAWWALRIRFQKTYRWVVEGIPCNADEIISINTKKCKEYHKLEGELGQVTYKADDTTGKFKVDKKPDNMPSPNMADALVMRMFGTGNRRLVVTDDMVRAVAAIGRRRRYG